MVVRVDHRAVNGHVSLIDLRVTGSTPVGGSNLKQYIERTLRQMSHEELLAAFPLGNRRLPRKPK